MLEIVSADQVGCPVTRTKLKQRRFYDDHCIIAIGPAVHNIRRHCLESFDDEESIGQLSRAKVVIVNTTTKHFVTHFFRDQSHILLDEAFVELLALYQLMRHIWNFWELGSIFIDDIEDREDIPSRGDDDDYPELTGHEIALCLCLKFLEGAELENESFQTYFDKIVTFGEPRRNMIREAFDYVEDMCAMPKARDHHAAILFVTELVASLTLIAAHEVSHVLHPKLDLEEYDRGRSWAIISRGLAWIADATDTSLYAAAILRILKESAQLSPAEDRAKREAFHDITAFRMTLYGDGILEQSDALDHMLAIAEAFAFAFSTVIMKNYFRYFASGKASATADALAVMDEIAQRTSILFMSILTLLSNEADIERCTPQVSRKLAETIQMIFHYFNMFRFDLNIVAATCDFDCQPAERIDRYL